MATLSKQIVDSFGVLTEVRGRKLSGVGLAALTLRFEHGSVLIEAVGEDDTINVATVPEARGEVLSDLAPWRDAIGRGVVWVWSLTNQQGYQDGTQLEFGKPAERNQPSQLCVQLIVAASALQVATVSDCS